MLAVYATQVAAGLCVLACLRRPELRWSERLARALLLGPAALAVQMFGYHLMSVPFRLALVLPPWWLALFLLRRQVFAPSTAPRAPASRHWLTGFAAALFTASLIQGLLVPLHLGDGLDNFAVIARIFETEGSLAPAELVDDVDASHAEYPPLVALNEALVFLAAGDARATAIEPFFALAGLALWLLAIELAQRRLPPRWATPVAALFLAWPVGYMHATWDFADLRLTAALLLAVVEGTRLLDARRESRREHERASCAFGAAVALCACAWTKNEGLALAALALPVLCWLMRRAGSTRVAVAGVALLVSATAVAWPLFRLAHGIEDEYWNGAASASALERLPRLGAVLARFAALPFSRNTAGNSEWGLSWPVAAVLVVAGLFVSRKPRSLAFALALLAAHALSYASALALTPQPLTWHLDTAAARLWTHTYPLLLLAVCAACRAIAGEEGSAAARAPDEPQGSAGARASRRDP